MKKVLMGLLFILVFGAGVLWYAKGVSKVGDAGAKKVVKIGVLYPLSKDFGHIGEAGLNAVKLFEEKLNEGGKYEFVVEDSQLNAAKAVTIIKKMIDFDKIDALITIESNVGNAISPIAEQNKILHLSISTDENVAKGKYNFTIATPPAVEAKKLVDLLVENGMEKIAVVMQNQGGIIATTNEIRQDDRVKVVFDETINSGTKDFRIFIGKLIKTEPDVVVAQLFNPELPIFAKQLREAGSGLRITNVEVMGLPEDKSLFEGEWFVDAAAPTSDFADQFYEKFGMSTNYAEFLFAGLEILDYGFVESSTVEEAVERLQKLKKLDTALGVVGFDENGVMISEPSVKIIKNGKAVVVGE